MAGVVDRLRRRTRSPPQQDWNNSGSFINKPSRGWLHPDDQLKPDAGVCYGVRYIGCMVVTQSMKMLDFDTRTAVAKESISRVCDSAGLKSPTKKNKRSAKINKILGGEPNLIFAGSNVNLTITTENLSLMVMETGEVIASHQMPGISFASGGDPDTMDFVAYVAKDPVNGRACFVLECGGGLAQDVITTIGQAFELRFKQFLATRPEAVSVPDRLEDPVFRNGSDQWGEEKDYYNDRPGAQPPSPVEAHLPPQYSSPKSNLPVSDGVYTPVHENQPALGNLIDLDGPSDEQGAVGGDATMGIFYDNPGHLEGEQFDARVEENVYDTNDGAASGVLDAFDMKPFNSVLGTTAAEDLETSPTKELWYHGQLTRQQTEVVLKNDGDFLVRESANSPGQYVLSGMHNGRIRHLLLVDPEGVVRTKDRTFNSVGHLINYHLENKIPIVSQDSELALKNPVLRVS